MKHIFVTFDQAEQIFSFVKIMSKCDFDADVKLGSRIVDAKSIVGVLSLAKSRTVEVIVHTDNCDNIIDQIAAIVPIAA